MGFDGEVSPERDRGPDPRAVRSRAAVLAAARELLIEQGVVGVTHLAVAARSGVGRATLYRHWPDAADLLRDTLIHCIQIATYEPVGDLRQDLLGELAASREMLHDPAMDRALRVIIERASVDTKFAEVKDILYRSGARSLHAVLADAVARGDLPEHLDIEFAADLLYGPLFFRRLVANRTFTETYVRQVVDAFLRTHANR